MLAKLENGQLILLPKTYTHNGVTISNYDLLPEETLYIHRWKPLIKTPAPPAEENVGYSAVYTDDGKSIVQSWEAHEIPPTEPVPDIAEIAEALEILLGAQDNEL